MDEIGKILQQARKKKRYSVEKVHKMTKIKEAYIVGLENSDISAFPAEIYYKNFLKSYSKFLGLNPDEISDLYEQYKLERAQDLFREDIIVEQTADSFKVKMIITIALFILIFILLFLLTSNNTDTHKITAENINSQPITAVKQEPAKNSVPEKTKQKLVIEALKNTWIKVDCDNKTIYEETLSAGKKYEASADDNFIIKIGNTNGVNVYFNDTKVDILTGSSENKVNTITLKKS